MRLGMVMTGMGAHAAACVGVMKELERRGVEAYAVCGMHAGAWPAALYAAGADAGGMEKALHQAAAVGRRMIAPSAYDRLFGHRMPMGTRLNRLVSLQTGETVLSLCAGAALFPCRMAKNGQRVVFSTRAFMQESGAILAMQATVGFAARAAMATPPFLAPLSLMGSALVPESDTEFACRQLLSLGAQRVLVIAPQPSPRKELDALELAGAVTHPAQELRGGGECTVLRIVMPDSVGALSLERMQEACDAGEYAARRELDALLHGMGMAGSRVLPFRRGLAARQISPTVT